MLLILIFRSGILFSKNSRKIVYILLLKCAHQEPDMALLAINTLQKDMADQNAFVRATGLVVMSMINIPGLSALCKVLYC